MGLRIGTNVASLAAQSRLAEVSNRLSKSYLRLATGRRANSAADDSAAIAISSTLTSQVRSLNQAVRNANDGLSMLTTAEGALEESNDLLQRMRELAVQSSNGTLSSSQRSALSTEFESLRGQLDQIADGVDFNGIALLNGTSTITLQVGPDTTASTNQITFGTVDVNAAALTMASADASIGTAGNANTSLDVIDSAITQVANNRATLGASASAVETTISSLTRRSESLAAANSRMIDVDVAAETAELTKNSVLQQTALAVLSQANAAPTAALQLLG